MADEERKARIEKLRCSWKERIGDWQESGLSQSEYCRRHNLKFHQFVYWRRKYAPAPVSTDQTEIVELPFGLRAASGLSTEARSSIRLALGNGYRIEVERDFDPIALRQLIHLLDRS